MKPIAHGLAALVALGSLASGIGGMIAGVPAALSLYCIVTGLIVGTMVPFSLRGSRGAWSMMVAILFVDAVGTFFGAGPLSRALDVAIPVAVLVPFALAASAVALSTLHADYRD